MPDKKANPAAEMTEPVPPPHKTVHWGVLTIVGFVVVLSAAYLYVPKFFVKPFDRQANIQRLTSLTPSNLIGAFKKGDFAAAKKELEAIQGKPVKNADEQALAMYHGGRINFRLSANVDDLLSDIRNYKKVFEDPSVDLWIRVRALNAISTAYCSSGRDPLAFEEIFNSAPYNQYLAIGDPDLSARQLAEWSYSLKPTSFAAIRVSRWFGQMAADRTKSDDARALYAAETKKWIAKADDALKSEIADNADFVNWSTYAAYRFWRAMAYGRLAMYESSDSYDRYATSKGMTKETTYIDSYQKEFLDMIRDVMAQNNVESVEHAELGRQYLAQMTWAIDPKNPIIKEQLDLLADEIMALPNPLTDTHVRMIRNEYQHRPDGQVWRQFNFMTQFSTKYKAMIQHLLELSPSVARAQ